MVCATYRKKRKETCTSHQIRNVEIEAALLYAIQQVTVFAKEGEEGNAKCDSYGNCADG